jgi:hypothetical protein
MATENNTTEQSEPKVVEETKTSKIMARHADGMSVGDISRDLGISYQHVYNTLKSKKVELEVRDKTNTTASKIVRLHKSGMTTGQISRELGITFQHVYNTLRQKNLITSSK